MISPTQVIDEKILPPACIATADKPWERFENNTTGICEGATWLYLPNGAFTGIVYSGHASFTSRYKLGLLKLAHRSADPLDPKSWIKRTQPLLVNDQSMPGPYAPGHASFLLSLDPGDGRIFCLYHGTDNWGEGFHNRKARVITLDSGAFGSGAHPVCCSQGDCSIYTWNSQPEVRAEGSSSHDINTKIEEKIGKYAHRAPAPVRKALDKFKKFL
jgi:hypothetical protein